MEDLIKTVENLLRTRTGEISGTDDDDRIYSNLMDMWTFELKLVNNEVSPQSTWYSKAFEYWEDEMKCPISDDGVLGGFGAVTTVDVKESNAFLDKVLDLRPGLRLQRVADCGAGIGRVSKNFLLHRAEHVDLVEQSPRLLSASAGYIGSDSARTTCICSNLQNFKPAPNTYDVIWIQWVVGHLHDLDYVEFFRHCVRGLTPQGVVVLKDNTVDGWTFVVDREDSSVTRSSAYSCVLFEVAEVEVLLEARQQEFPADLNPIHMIALVPTGS